MQKSTKALLAAGAVLAIIWGSIYATTFASVDLVLGSFTLAAAGLDLIIKLIVGLIPSYLVYSYINKKSGNRRMRRMRY